MDTACLFEILEQDEIQEQQGFFLNIQTKYFFLLDVKKSEL